MSMLSKAKLEFEIRAGLHEIAAVKISIATAEARKEERKALMEFNERDANDIAKRMDQFDDEIRILNSKLTLLQGELDRDMAEYKNKQE